MNDGRHRGGPVPPAGGPGGVWGAIPTSDHLIGARVGNFTVQKMIGQGAMGAVYLAAHTTLHRKVAIKVLKPMVANNQTLVQRFIDEAHAVSALGHPGLVQVFDFGALPDGRFYTVMEYLEGRDLEELVRTAKRLEPGRAVAIAMQAASAVGAAHARGIVHRDLKPANLFLVSGVGGTGDVVKVLDFGIAKLTTTDGNEQLARTAAGHVVGTPEYMSPEQARPNQPIDPRTDVYALGCVLYELLSGKPPFVADNIPALLLAHQTQQPEPLSTRVRIAPELNAVVMRCLEKPPDARFGSMLELEEALAPFADELPESVRRQFGSAASMRIPPKRSGGTSKLNRVLAWVAVGTVALLSGVALALYLTGGKRAAQPSQVAPASSPDAGVVEISAEQAQRSRGEVIWREKCASCHGLQGEGDGKDTPAGLEPKAFADMHVAEGMLDEYRFSIIQDGVKSSKDPDAWLMPAFGTKLSPEQTRDVVAFVATLSAPAPRAARLAPSEPKPALTRKLARTGSVLYRKKCASCHGESGRGDGRAARYLKRKPADLTKGVYKLRSTPRDSLPTDEDLFRTLAAGMGVRGMPSFAKLPEQDRWALVAYVQSLSPRFRKQKPDAAIELPAAPELSAERVKRGKIAFDAAGCTGCHGESGLGDGKDADSLKTDRGDPIRPPTFAAPFIFIGGETPSDVYRTMMTGVAGTPMPAGADYFDADQGWDVVAYILSLREH